MPIYINNSTGQAEDVATPSAEHEVPLISPEGQPGTASAADASSLLSQGYKQPSQSQLQELMFKAARAKEPVPAAMEAGMSAITGGLSTGVETSMGIPGKEITGRREENPVAHAVGEVAGLGLGLMAGAPALSAEAGALAAAKIGTESAIGRVGSAAAKVAIENMLITSGDEASKAFAQDPNQSAETIVGNLGLSAVLGGVLGGGSKGTMELWKSGPGKSLESLMGAVKNRTGGVPAELRDAAGIVLSPEMEGALSGNPEAQKAFQTLQESNSSSGAKAQKAFAQFHEDIKGAAASALDKTPEAVAELHNISDYEAGAAIKSNLQSQLKETVAPISKAYDEFAEKFKGAEIVPEAKAGLANKIGELTNELGLHKSASDSGLKLVNQVLEALPKQETAQDLRNFARNLGNDNPFGSENYHVAKQVGNLIKGLQDETISTSVGAKAPELLEAYKATQKQYSELRDLLSTLNDRLHVGKYSGAQSFLQNLGEMQPEDVVRRLSTKSDADLQALLQSKFPAVSASVQEHELNKMLKSTLDKSGEAIDPKKLFKKLQSLQPEQRAYLISPEQQAKLDAIHGLLERVPAKMNPSGTAKTLDMLWDNIPASATAMASMLLGHNPIAGFILGKIGSLVGKEVPDAVRLATLKFLGSEAPTSAAALKEAIHLADSGIKAEKAFSKAVKGVFGEASNLKEPTASEIEKLRTRVDAASADPEHLMSIGGEANHYMPDHVVGASAAATRTVQYLTSIKPSTTPAGILDMPKVASKQEESEYTAALRLAENPLLVLNSLRDGTLTVKEIGHMQAMYPALYNKMQNAVSEQMMDAVHAGKPIKYKTKLATSMFLGQPLSSSMQPQSIMSAQMSLQGHAQQRQAGLQAGPKNTKSSLTKLPGLYETPQQDRVQRRMAK